MPSANTSEKLRQVLAEIQRLEDLFLQCRAVFPTVSQEAVGHRRIATAPFYLRRGYRAEIHLPEPITAEFIERNRQLGKWINENAIIRLYGILSYHGYLERIDQTRKGWREVDLMRRMRDAFTKTPLNYRPNVSKNVKLRAEILAHFGLAPGDFPDDEIPTPINTVVEPIFNKCREYVTAQESAHNKSMEATR